MEPILYADCVGKQYGIRSVLSSASLRAYPGQQTAILGRNGVGKSTLLKICAGWIKADHGRIAFGGEFIARPRLHRLARLGLCYLPSDGLLFTTSFQLGRQLAEIAKDGRSGILDEVISTLNLETLLDQHPQSLSGGEQRRVGIAVAWLINPKCLLADEPLRGIDPLDQERIMGIFARLAEGGAAVVITGHQAESLLDKVDDVVWTTGGTTYHLGPPGQAREHWQFRREFLGPGAF